MSYFTAQIREILGIFGYLKATKWSESLEFSHISILLGRFSEHGTTCSVWSFQIKIKMPLFVVSEVFVHQSINQLFQWLRQI